MKKAIYLFLTGLLLFAACRKDPEPEIYKDAELTGEKVDVSALAKLSARKIFLLNEGQMGANNASLDVLRLSDGNYVTGAFRKMNPDAGAGLGDVGNDLLVIGDELWIVINNSGLIEVVSAKDETEIAVITVPTPRNIADDGQYAYVSSWAGAYASYGADYSISDYKNPKGQVYRINLKTKKLEGSAEVGYQPEGLAVCNGKLYVANSGGIASQLPPSYTYDNTVSVIDTKTFKVEKTVEVQVNLKNVFPDGDGGVYVTTLGNYWDVHSGLYWIDANGKVTHVADYVSVAALQKGRQHDNILYCLGSEQEYDWSGAPKTWKGFSCVYGELADLFLNVTATAPYGFCVLDGISFLLSDAGDYFNPGSVSLYQGSSAVWTVTTGVCPGHFAIW